MTSRRFTRQSWTLVILLALAILAIRTLGVEAQTPDPPTVTVHSVQVGCDLSWVTWASVGLLLLVVPAGIAIANVVNAIMLHIKRGKR